MVDLPELIALLQMNQDKNFVQRILKPDLYPVLPMENNNYATHLMGYATNDNGAIVYPNVIQLGDNLKLLQPKEAIEYALRNNEYIKFNNPQDAEWFSKNYKKVWGQPY